jgi:hypothetical protein
VTTGAIALAPKTARSKWAFCILFPGRWLSVKRRSRTRCSC